jgi:hypothetical protein
MEAKNLEIFMSLLDAHPEGISHADLRNWWTGGGSCRPLAAELKTIAKYLTNRGTIHVTEIPSKRGRPATVYQLAKHASDSNIRLPGGKRRFTDKMLDNLEAYLLTGRTFRQLTKKFGQDVREYLTPGPWGSYNLFKDINKNGEHSFLLLPKVKNWVADVAARDWTYHIPTLGGKQQPYQMIQMPEDVFRIDGRYGRCFSVVPLFDVHYGSNGHRHGKFQKYLRWIAETPGLYVILGGDLMDNALDDGRGMCYDQDIPPQSQLDDMTEMLAPIAHRVLTMFPGNHEWRTYKKTGIDISKILADRLDIPYHTGPVLLSILAGDHKYTIDARHGFTRPGTKGGQLNSAMKPTKWMDADFFLSGHTHEALVSEDTVMREKAQDGSLAFVPRWVVIAQSFLGWLETYGYRAGYGPVAGGGVLLEMYENGERLPSTR